jgi:photosystem II stability/assembly factor-like uncharacterized protein
MPKMQRKFWVRFRVAWVFGLIAAADLLPFAVPAPSGSAPAAAGDRVPGRDQLGQSGGSVVTAIGNLGPHAGWVLIGNKLASTVNDGQSWTDITPPAMGDEPVDRAYFLDTMNSWVLKTRHSSIKNREVRSLLVCHTTNGGKTWTSTPILAANPGDVEQFSGHATFQFVDAKTGWLTLSRWSGANFQIGELLSTADGGTSWTRKSIIPFGSVSFPSATVGWLAGGPGGRNLYQTVDGGASWSAITVPLPATVPKTWEPIIYSPRFSDPTNGVLPVVYHSPKRDGFAAVLFQTSNGGVSWITKNINIKLGGVRSSIVAGGQQPTVVELSGNKLTVMAADGSGQASSYSVSNTNAPGIYFSVPMASFSSNGAGWVLVENENCPNGSSICKTTDSILSTTTSGREFEPIILPVLARLRVPDSQ